MFDSDVNFSPPQVYAKMFDSDVNSFWHVGSGGEGRELTIDFKSPAWVFAVRFACRAYETDSPACWDGRYESVKVYAVSKEGEVGGLGRTCYELCQSLRGQ